MNSQNEFGRRTALKAFGVLGATSLLGRAGAGFAQDSTLSLWAAPIAKPFDDWAPINEASGVNVAWSPKSASADEALTKMMVGDGQKLYDAFTDNGGGMEDAMAENGVIAPLDVSRMKNWGNLRDDVRSDDGVAAHSVRYQGDVYAVPYIANADSLAYDRDAVGADPDSWAMLFDPEFKGRVAMQDDFGPTLTNTAIYLHESGQVEIEDRSNMSKDEVKAVAEFLIDQKNKGQFRTFWNGFQQGVDLMASGEVVMMSCWEPIQLVSRRKSERDIRYGNMKEGHQVWNNVVMMTRGAAERGREGAFYSLADVFLSPWYCSKQLAKFGFASLTDGVGDYVKAHPDDFDVVSLTDILERKEQRYARPGNAWQNVYPKELRAYQEWWSQVQAA
ncbi:MAG: ABC transporter substrate-binding protein [Gammaproteobacteria bacterium]